MSEDFKWFITFLVTASIVIIILILSVLYYNTNEVYTVVEVNGSRCVQVNKGYNEEDNGLYCRYEGGR